MYEKINEPIEVFATFSKKGTEPICFTWNRQDYNITSVNFRHKSNNGSHPVYHFAVTSNNETYKLTFDPIDLNWTLDEVYLDTSFKTVDSLNDKYLDPF